MLHTSIKAHFNMCSHKRALKLKGGSIMRLMTPRYSTTYYQNTTSSNELYVLLKYMHTLTYLLSHYYIVSRERENFKCINLRAYWCH
jgi:hypothetical protein